MNHIKPTSFTIHSKRFLLISMATFFFLALLSLLLFFSLSSATRHHNHHPTTLASTPLEIHLACKATRYPETCEASLVQSHRVPPNADPIEIIHSATWVSSENLKTAQQMVTTILDSSSGNPNKSTAARNCLEVLRYSEYRISSTVGALTRGRIKDARVWMSAALSYQFGCWSGLKYVNDSEVVNETMAFLVSLTGLTSNALSMVVSYDIFGNETGSWKPPMTERVGFWEGGGAGSGFNGGFPSGLTANVTVCKDGGEECYKTVQEAVDVAPDNEVVRRFVIHIKEGVYEETVRVPLEKRNVVFLGDGMGKTVITGSLNLGQPGISTTNTATVG